jgi:plastocyanin
MMKRIAIALTFSVIGGTCQAGTVSVDQKSLSFDKTDLTVGKGDIVSFNNSDNTSHNILISGEGTSVNGGLQQPGQSFAAPFIKPGTFQVTCAIHPKMKMTIHVQ